MRYIWALGAIVTGFVGITTGAFILALIAFELLAIIGVMFGHIFLPDVFPPSYQGHLVTHYMFLVQWALGGLVLFVFFESRWRRS